MELSNLLLIPKLWDAEMYIMSYIGKEVKEEPKLPIVY